MCQNWDMDLSRPAEQLFGENSGRILHRLSIMSDELTGRRIAELAAVPPSSAARVLDELESIGLVTSRPVGAARVYRLNRHHVLWNPIEAILASQARLEQVAMNAVRAITQTGVTLATFGSFARGDARANSDIDLLLVWDDGVTEDVVDSVLEALQVEVTRASGNRVEIVSIMFSQLAWMIANDDPLVDSWRQDARTLLGTEARRLMPKFAS
jgi:predicted nucleotidyltransferase